YNVQNRIVQSDYGYLRDLDYQDLIPPPIDPPIDLSWKPDLERITDINRTSRTFQSKHLSLLDDTDLGMANDLGVALSAFHGNYDINPIRIGHLDTKDIRLVVPPKDRTNMHISASETVHQGNNTEKTME
ncbi:496_t:CDS:2, partial [Gigaspora rosea]